MDFLKRIKSFFSGNSSSSSRGSGWGSSGDRDDSAARAAEERRRREEEERRRREEERRRREAEAARKRAEAEARARQAAAERQRRAAEAQQRAAAQTPQQNMLDSVKFELPRKANQNQQSDFERLRGRGAGVLKPEARRGALQKEDMRQFIETMADRIKARNEASATAKQAASSSNPELRKQGENLQKTINSPRNNSRYDAGVAQRAKALREKQEQERQLKETLDTQVRSRRDPTKVVRLADREIGSMNGRTVSSLVQQAEAGNAWSQRRIVGEIEDAIKNLSEDFSDEAELERIQLSAALQEIQPRMKNTAGTVATDIVKGLALVEPIKATTDGLGDLGYTLTGERQRRSEASQAQANGYYDAAIRARQEGNIERANWLQSLGDEQAREARRAIGNHIEASDPIKAAATVAQAVALPFAAAAGGGAAFTAGRTGLGALTNLGGRSISNLTGSQLAKQGLGPRLSTLLGETADAAVWGVPESIANVYREQGSEATAGDVLGGVAQDAAMTAALPGAGYALGRGVRGLRQVAGRYPQLSPGPESVPEKVPISKGISSKNAADAERARQAEAQQAAQVEALLAESRQARRQAQAQRLQEEEARAVSLAEMDSEANELGLAGVRLNEEHPMSGAVVSAQPKYLPDAPVEAAPVEAPPVRQSADPEVVEAQTMAAREAEGRSRQAAQVIEEPAPVDRTPAKTEGRLEAEQVQAATPPAQPARRAEPESAPANPTEAKLRNVEGDIAAIKAQGREVPEGLLSLQKQLRNDLIEEREMSRAASPEPAAPVRKADPAPAPDAPNPKTEALKALRERHEKTNSYEERGLLARLIRATEQGDATPAKAARLKKAEKELAEFTSSKAPAKAKTADAKPTKAPAKATTKDAPEKIDLPYSKGERYTLVDSHGDKTRVMIKTNKRTGKKTIETEILDSNGEWQFAGSRNYDGYKSALLKDGVSEPDADMARRIANYGDANGSYNHVSHKMPAEAPSKAPSSRSADLEEHADIDPQTNMPKEDLKSMTGKSSDKAPAKAEAPFKPTPAKSVLAKEAAPAKPRKAEEAAPAKAETLEQKTARLAQQKNEATAKADAKPTKDSDKALQSRIKRAETSLGKAEEKLKQLKIANNEPNKIKAAEAAVEKIKSRLEAMRELGDTPKSHQPTAEQLAVKPTKARKEKAKAKRAEQRKTAKEEGVKLKKGLAGGNVANFMARNIQETTGGAARVSDLLGEVSKAEAVSFKTDYPKALNKAMNSSTDEMLSASRTMADGKDLSYKGKLNAVSYSTASGYRLDVLAKELVAAKTKAAKAKIRKEIKKIHETQGNLLEAAAKADQEHGRAMGLSAWLFKNLDPGVVSSRIIRQGEKLNDDPRALVDPKTGEKADMSYTPKERETIAKLTERLKKAFDADDKVATEYEKNLSTLESKTATPKEKEAAAKALAKNESQYAKSQERLKAAYFEVNKFTEAREMKFVREGKLAQPVTYGVGFNRYQKLNMLSGPAGRIKDLASTGIHMADLTLLDMAKAVGGKVANKLGKTDSYHSTALWSKASVKRGAKEGWRKTKDVFAGREDTGMGLTASSGGFNRGNKVTDRLHEESYAPDSLPAKAGKLRTLAHKGANFIRGGVAAPTHLLGEPYTAMKLDTLYRDKGSKLGLKGSQLEAYVSAKVNKPDADVLKGVEYTADEVSGLQSKWSKDLDRWHRRMLKDHATWDGDKTKKGWRASRTRAQVTGWGITAMKNATIPFTSWPLSATKSMITTHNPLYHAGKAIVDGAMAKNATPANKAKHMQDLVDSLSGFAYSGAKVGVAYAALSPFLSDTDADGNAYNPPYIKIPLGDGKYYSNDLGVLGAAAAPLIAAWSAKKALESEDSKLFTFLASYVSGTYGKTGVSDSIDTRNVPMLDPILRGLRSYSGVDNGLGGAMDDAFKEMLTDIASQSVLLSGFNRDLQSLYATSLRAAKASGLDVSDEKLLAPNNKAIDRETGEENKAMSGVKTVAGILPGVSEFYERNEDGRERTGFLGKLTGSKTTTAEKAQENREEETKVKEINKSLSGLGGLTEDSKLYGMLSEDNKKTLKKAGINDRELTSKELSKIRNELAQDKVAHKMLKDNDWDGYTQSRRLKLDKLEAADGVKDDKAIADTRREIKRAELAKKEGVSTEIYQMYSGAGREGGKVGESDIKKMLEPENWEKDLEKSQQLIALDMLFTENELSYSDSGSEGYKSPVYKDALVRNVGQASIAQREGIEGEVFKLYTGIGMTGDGASISQTELNKMFDEGSDTYDPELGEKLLAIDKLMTENELSANSSGVNPWLRRKYKEKSARGGGSGRGGRGGGGGSGSSKEPTVPKPTYGAAKRIAAEGPAVKYRELQGRSSPIPNLASQTSQTALKKNITVKKGVQL